ncbi:MAG: ABC transporter ATP-binding protein [Acidobacteria bacterium]|nr:ABC transporter ATP-binding protein [Acidobacteriota bacterium]
MLQVADVSFGYGTADRPALVIDRVSATITRGALAGVLGPNGSGKTTLLRLMSGTRVPTHGSVLLDGQPLRQLSRRELARRLAVVPQETHLAFDYTVMEMVLMGRHPHLGLFEVEGPSDLAVAREALASTGTETLEARDFNTLSGGEKQRVIIAAALAQASDVLLLDEPTASLDLGYQLEIATLLRHLNQERGVTMVVSTHDLNLAAALCRELILLRDGRVLAAGPVAQVLTPENIRRLYDVEADVHVHDGTGHLTVVPLRRVER